MISAWMSGTAVGLLAALTLAGCGAVEGDDLVGEWESTSSDASIEILADGTFDATNYPTGVEPGGECTLENIERESWSGWVDFSTIDLGFVYANGVQWWMDDAPWSGLQLRVDICGETLAESFEKSE